MQLAACILLHVYIRISGCRDSQLLIYEREILGKKVSGGILLPPLQFKRSAFAKSATAVEELEPFHHEGSYSREGCYAIFLW